MANAYTYVFPPTPGRGGNVTATVQFIDPQGKVAFDQPATWTGGPFPAQDPGAEGIPFWLLWKLRPSITETDCTVEFDWHIWRVTILIRIDISPIS